MDKSDIEKKIEEIEKIVKPFVDEMKLSLVDVEYMQEGGYWYVRIFIENLNGELSIEDCSKLSTKIEDKIENIIDKRFFLEVSSPGLERPLKKIEDYIRFKGDKITLHLKHKLNDKKQFKAIIKDVIENNIVFEIDKADIEIEFKEIRKANILFEFSDF
ncbi:MAG: ribosome maturation factor RimP [Fusobacterium sp.]|nr:ribosome maturation factor RimP [Fusobacterium sp.]